MIVIEDVVFKQVDDSKVYDHIVHTGGNLGWDAENPKLASSQAYESCQSQVLVANLRNGGSSRCSFALTSKALAALDNIECLAKLFNYRNKDLIGKLNEVETDKTKVSRTLKETKLKLKTCTYIVEKVESMTLLDRFKFLFKPHPDFLYTQATPVTGNQPDPYGERLHTPYPVMPVCKPPRNKIAVSDEELDVEYAQVTHDNYDSDPYCDHCGEGQLENFAHTQSTPSTEWFTCLTCDNEQISLPTKTS